MARVTRFMVVALVTLGLTAQAQAAPAAGAQADLPERTRAGVTAMDETEYYKSPDSSTLGWGESYVLTAYYWMYEATGDAAWLDRMVRRAEVVFANLSPGEELHPGWRTARYSVALADVAAASGNSSQAAIRADPARVYNIDQASKVSGHDYEIRVTAEQSVEVTDTTTGERVAAAELPGDGRLTQIPGVVVVIEGEPRPGDRFSVRTQAPKPLEYVVHDGMILTPIAKFCAAALGDAALEARYGATARRYVQIMETQLVPKWERYWRDSPDGGGLYIAQGDPAQRFPGASLPHNQYLALGRAHIALYRATGKATYREHAEKMARFFKRNLRLVEGHCEWNYWDHAGSWDGADARRMEQVEDTSHGHIDVGFAVDAYDAGIVFDRQDLERFARTVSDVMWNGSEDEPRLGGRVNSAEGDSTVALDWVRLGRFSPRTRRIMTGLLESAGQLGGASAAAGAQALAMERIGWSARPRYAAPPAGVARP